MNRRLVEIVTALVCTVFLVAGVAGGVVFARGAEEGINTAAASDEPPGGAYEELSTPLPTDVTDSRTAVPWYRDGAERGVCPIRNGVPYVDAQALCAALGLDVTTRVSGSSYTLVGDAAIRADDGECWFRCGGRCVYVSDGVYALDGHLYLPLDALADCLGVTVWLDPAAWQITVGGEASPPDGSESYCDETDLYWLSRVISAEAGGEPFETQLYVGGVILNRVADESFGGSVYDVIFEKNQFDVVINGMIYMEPEESACVAACLALEGVDVTDGSLYLD